MPIRAVGVWDTVGRLWNLQLLWSITDMRIGSLGIPLPWHSKNVKAYSFVNSKVAKHVQHAFQALALDEQRHLFTPTLWEQPDEPHKLNLLKQCWFAGVHANIGGWYDDAGQSNITLAWMISQLEDTDGGILSFDPTYLDWVQDKNTKYYSTVPEPVRPWGMGRVYDSLQSTSLMGKAEALFPIIRTPGRYCKIDTETGKQTKERLLNTNESIHRSVRVRIDGGGLGTEEDPDTSKTTKVLSKVKKVAGVHKDDQNFAPNPYNSPSLSNYQLVQSPAVRMEVDHSGKGPSPVIWKAKDGLESLPEDQLGRTEIRLLKRSVETAHI